MQDIDYCRNLARNHAYGEYLCALTLPPEARAGTLALIALDSELRLVAAKVREEMLAHIRYAWWREHLDKKMGDHPVLKAIAALELPPALAGAMVDEAQLAWPNVAGRREALHAAIGAMLDAQGRERWQRSIKIVEKHGEGRRWLLALRMLLA